jgi:hypothetical protein
MSYLSERDKLFDGYREKVEEARNKITVNNLLRLVFIEIFGVSGWLMLYVIFLENRIAFPVTGTNYPLDHVELLTVALWALARWGHFFRQMIKLGLKKINVL